MILRYLLLLLSVAALPAVAQADTTRPAALWAHLTLGPGHASNRDGVRIGAQAAVFGSYGKWIAGVRRSGASGIESGGAYDDALLIGRRKIDLGSTMFAAIGPARIFDESTGQSRFGIGATAEFGGNIRYLGLGITAFGAFSPSLSHIGIGATLDAGWIR